MYAGIFAVVLLRFGSVTLLWSGLEFREAAVTQPPFLTILLPVEYLLIVTAMSEVFLRSW